MCVRERESVGVCVCMYVGEWEKKVVEKEGRGGGYWGTQINIKIESLKIIYIQHFIDTYMSIHLHGKGKKQKVGG